MKKKQVYASTSAEGESAGRIEKRVREGIICDNSGYFPISVWEYLVELKENTWYMLSEVIIKHYEGKRLQTTRGSIAKEIQVDLDRVVDWTMVPEVMFGPGNSAEQTLSRNVTMNCKIVSVLMNTYPICVNQKCAKKVQIVPGEKIVKCNSCFRKMLSGSCPCGLNCMVDVEGDGAQMSLTIFPSELGELFGEDLIEQYSEKPEILEEKLLLLDNIVITYNKKNVVTKISQ